MHILRSRIAVVSGLLAIGLVGVIGWYFIDLDLTIGNVGHTVAYTELALYVLFALLFGVFIAGSVYKYRYFKDMNAQSVSRGGIGGIFGVLVAGCPACSITLASWLGLSSLLGFLPYGGTELKVIAILILGYTVYVLLRDLEVCSIPSKDRFSLSSLYIDMDKMIVGIAIVAGITVSGRALRGYAQTQGLLASDLRSTQTYKTQQAPSQPIPTKAPAKNTYFPSTAPSGVCGGSNGGGGCGCGG